MSWSVQSIDATVSAGFTTALLPCTKRLLTARTSAQHVITLFMHHITLS